MRLAARALASVLAAAALLAAAEGGLRLAGARPRPRELPRDFKYWYLDTREPFFRVTASGPEGATYGMNRPVARDKAFTVPKPAGVARVFVVGGSVALPFSGGRLLDDAFERALPGRKVEVIGCGMGGYDSLRELEVVREALRLSPDLVVVMSGNNEYLPPPLEHPRLARWAAAASRLALFGLFAGAPRPVPPLTAAQRSAAFEANLRAMTRAASDAGVPLAFCALPANLRDSAPTSPPPLPWSAPGFFAALAAEESGETASAAALYAAYGRESPEPHSRFRLARALDRLGRRAAAAKAYAEASDLDVPGERTPPARAEIVRRVARETGSVLVDLRESFERASPDGIVGDALMRDSCHWRFPYDPWVAALIAAGVARHPAAPAALARRDAPLPPPRRGRLPESEAVDLLHSGLAKAVQAPADAYWEESLFALGRARRFDPARFDAVAFSTAAMAAALPRRGFQDYGESFAAGGESLWSHIAESLRRAGRPDDARRALERALAADPGAVRPRVTQALLWAAAGDAARAADSMERLAAERPDARVAALWASYWRAKAGGRS